ncbi:MAG: hypothetical protein KIT58_23595, partial [Planctomycetota bacterium]|nr:hypothetical protein [Planctomycetota bacterium]
PLTEARLAPLPPTCERATITAALAPDELDRVGAFLRGYPEIELGLAGTLLGALSALPGLTRLPSLRRLERRREAWLLMVGVTALSPVAEAPGLLEFTFATRAKVPPEIVLPLAGHPTLQRAGVWLPSRARTERATELLGLPPVFEPAP